VAGFFFGEAFAIEAVSDNHMGGVAGTEINWHDYVAGTGFVKIEGIGNVVGRDDADGLGI